MRERLSCVQKEMPSKVNEIPLLSNRCRVRVTRDGQVFFGQSIRVDIVTVSLVLILLVTGQIALFVVRPIICSPCRARGSLPNLASAIDMWQPAPSVLADTRIGIVWAFKYVPIRTIRTCVTIAKNAEWSAYWCSGIHPYVSVPAIRIGALALQEVKTRRNTLGTGGMRQIARFTRRTCPGLEISLADCNLIGIMKIRTQWSFDA